MSLSSVRSEVNARIESALDELAWMADQKGDSLRIPELMDPVISLMRGGKRTRALLLASAARCMPGVSLTSIVNAGAALEFYQGSALIHDDVIDRAPTRRSLPATHVAYTHLHETSQWSGDPDHFGHSAAILAGDLLLSLAHELMIRACTDRPEALLTFTRMTSEVAFGQYLDLRAEVAPATGDAIEAALAVLTHKSARYSVVAPLTIGARLAGASPELVAALEAIGRPLGEAFQLRDDDLGIFGNETFTGKPVCGDIAEGKRTALLALALTMLSSDDAERLASIVGSPVSADDALWIREAIETCGARNAHEAMISERESTAHESWTALCQSGLAEQAGLDMLGEMLNQLSVRVN